MACTPLGEPLPSPANRGRGGIGRRDRLKRLVGLLNRYANDDHGLQSKNAHLAELADATGLKPVGPKGPSRFESGSGHHNSVAPKFRLSSEGGRPDELVETSLVRDNLRFARLLVVTELGCR